MLRSSIGKGRDGHGEATQDLAGGSQGRQPGPSGRTHRESVEESRRQRAVAGRPQAQEIEDRPSSGPVATVTAIGPGQATATHQRPGASREKGIHMSTAPQAGILNRPPDHALIATYALLGPDPTTVRATLEKLRDVVHRELRSDLDDTTPQSPKDVPSAETGELGFSDHYDRYHLTVTVGFARSAYDKLGVAAEQYPQDLVEIPWAGLSDAPTMVTDSGDLVVQLCSDSIYINEHVLRRIGEELGALLRPVWTLAGQQRHTSRAGRTSRDEGRALIGFVDGTSNLAPRHDAADAELVFVDPSKVSEYPPAQPVVDATQPNPYGGPTPPQFPADLRTPPVREPDWTKRGTYMVVRGSTFDSSAWDKRTLGDQEHVVGRFKVSGQALDQVDDPSAPIVPPNFPGDTAGAVTPFSSHIRKANPRGLGDDKRRIFRRGFPLIVAPGAGGLQRGLLFVCFGRTLTTQFEFITRAWTANPHFPHADAGVDQLRAIETVLCGGYYFVPPLSNAREPWSFVLPT